jgi:L-Ala-D/L-Glu epimerase / N-acetyl-D-glutamate racemase
LNPDRIVAFDAWPVDVPLVDPFVISRGSLAAAEIVVVRLRLADGTEGYGEAAPFPPLTGETRDGTLAACQRLAPLVQGTSASAWATLGATFRNAEPGAPAARAAIECAAADAWSRSQGEPLYRTFGGADVRDRTTDITLPILQESRIDELAAHWHARGFRTFKLKVGGDPAADAARVERLADRFADVAFVLDANQGFSRDAARTFIAQLRPCHDRIAMMEQPVDRADLDGMAALRAEGGVAIAADESVFTEADARRVIDAGAADIVNLKIMKCGLSETLAIAARVRAAGLGLMIGGMMETRLSMAVSFALALGTGGIGHLDLDTPLLLADDPFDGGYAYDGPVLRVWREPGVGMVPRQPPSPR